MNLNNHKKRIYIDEVYENYEIEQDEVYGGQDYETP